jgi:hypothetical protein
MNDFLITLAMGLFGLTAGTSAIVFRRRLRLMMIDLLISMYGRFGSLASDRLSPTAIVLAGSGFIGISVIAISIGLIKLLFL